MLNLVLAAFIATASPINLPIKKPEVKIAKKLDVIKREDISDYAHLIKWQSDQTS
ncbi:MAG: hypothetical protein IKK93_01125 [Campylobacter sp.]|nr:hypothetical protein [Campylobacter sp.]